MDNCSWLHAWSSLVVVSMAKVTGVLNGTKLRGFSIAFMPFFARGYLNLVMLNTLNLVPFTGVFSFFSLFSSLFFCKPMRVFPP